MGPKIPKCIKSENSTQKTTQNLLKRLDEDDETDSPAERPSGNLHRIRLFSDISAENRPELALFLKGGFLRNANPQKPF